MRRFNKYIAIFLTLAVLANGVFASQMNVLMIDNTSLEAPSSLDNSAPCHEKNSTNKSSITSDINGSNCCDGDCNDCYLGSTITARNSALVPIIHQTLINIAIDNTQLPAHVSNLYRPPILI